ncbi:Asp23/Gls24 family envelope stress response protein [uncultured Corynebacterium sp.]|uniref:Asp23/Gls24 family envelope stress response protein n=1 Tax=uncultured Corynebacterium sp. TaxID=159447 RepID=UPI00288B6FBE|nr:Asp23/Gls24 family envelope stress response protein [uncultured Corynebacterium sp.]
MDTSFYHVSERTIERVAEVAASTVPGSRNIDAKLAGLAGRSLPRIEAHIDRTTGLVAIDAEIATSYPAPVAAITDAVRATIIAHIRTLTGMDVSRVNVTVANVESIEDGSRVTWDDVATHDAFIIPEPIQVSPTEITHPVTSEREELAPIEARSLVDDMRAVTTPTPPSVRTPKQPQPVTVSGVDVPEPLEPFAPETPMPVALRAPSLPALQPLAPIAVKAFGHMRPVEVPWQRPLHDITVDRQPLKPVTIQPSARPTSPRGPAPKPVVIPQAPQPKPLQQITIEPVVKYYDRTN